jgi:hypothetical protein
MFSLQDRKPGSALIVLFHPVLAVRIAKIQLRKKNNIHSGM